MKNRINSNTRNIIYEPTLDAACHYLGMPVPNKQVPHGRFGRWGDNGNRGNKTPYFALLFPGGCILGDWREGISYICFYQRDCELSSNQLKQRMKEAAEAKKKADEERATLQAKAAEKAKRDWASFMPANPDHPYLVQKQILPHALRTDGVNLQISLQDINGEITSLQSIAPDGSKDLLYNGRKKGCFNIIGPCLAEVESICIVEGYATGAAVYEASGITTVVAFDAYNLYPVIEAIARKYPQMKIAIFRDDDAYKEPNIGKLEAEKAADQYGCICICPTFQVGTIRDSSTTDGNDVARLYGKETLRKQVLEGLEQFPHAKIPEDYEFRNGMLLYKEAIISTTIKVVARTRDAGNENWGICTTFHDPEGIQHKLNFPLSMLAGDLSECQRLFLSHGLYIPDKQCMQHLARYLQSVETDAFMLNVAKVGWSNCKFVLPDEVIPNDIGVCLQIQNEYLKSIRCSGTMLQWQDAVLSLCKGNSRLIFSVCASLAAPLLKIVGSDSFGFNFKGPSSIGKTTLLRSAASVVGSPCYIQQWRSTSNALEVIAESRNDMPMILDETGQVNSTQASGIGYLIGNSSGKARMKPDMTSQTTKTWRNILISSGEVGMSEKIVESGQIVRAGGLVRIIDIPADAGTNLGCFESLNGLSDGHALSNALKAATQTYYGVTVRAFLQYIVGNLDGLQERIMEYQQKFIENNVKLDTVGSQLKIDGQVWRIAGHFGIIAAAGSLAVEAGILCDKEMVMSSIAKCFHDVIEERGGYGSHEEREIMEQVLGFIQRHSSARFELLPGSYDTSSTTDKIHNQAGYKREDGIELEYYIFPEVFKKEVCKGLDAQMVARTLKKAGMLLHDKDNKLQKTVKIPKALSKKTSQKVYCVRLPITE